MKILLILVTFLLGASAAAFAGGLFFGPVGAALILTMSLAVSFACIAYLIGR
jgi:hypothetical protein